MYVVNLVVARLNSRIAKSRLAKGVDNRNAVELCRALNDFRKLKGHVGYMHLKDFDPETKEIMVLGKGKVDFPTIFNLLEEWSFDGFVGLDLETTRACTLNTLAAHEEELHRSLEYLESLDVIKQD